MRAGGQRFENLTRTSFCDLFTNVIFFYHSFSYQGTQVMFSIVTVSTEIVFIRSKVLESKDVYYIDTSVLLENTPLVKFI